MKTLSTLSATTVTDTTPNPAPNMGTATQIVNGNVVGIRLTSAGVFVYDQSGSVHIPACELLSLAQSHVPTIGTTKPQMNDQQKAILARLKPRKSASVLPLLFLFFMLCFSAKAANVFFNLVDILQNPSITNRPVRYQSYSVPTSIGANMAIGSVITNVTDGSGQFTMTNVILNAVYVITVLPPTDITQPQVGAKFTILTSPTIIGTNTTFNGNALLVADSISTFPAGTVAWSAAASDLRYIAASNAVPNGYTPISTNGTYVWAPTTGNGTVTSVGLSLPSWFTVGSAVTSAGNLTAGVNNQTATFDNVLATNGIIDKGPQTNLPLALAANYNITNIQSGANGQTLVYDSTVVGGVKATNFPTAGIIAGSGLLGSTNGNIVTLTTNGAVITPPITNLVAGSGLIGSTNGNTVTIGTNGSVISATITDAEEGPGILILTNGRVITIETNGVVSLTNLYAGSGLIGTTNSAGQVTLTTNGSTANAPITNLIAGAGLVGTTNGATVTFTTNGNVSVTNMFAGAGLVGTTNSAGQVTITTNGVGVNATNAWGFNGNNATSSNVIGTLNNAAFTGVVNGSKAFQFTTTFVPSSVDTVLNLQGGNSDLTTGYGNSILGGQANTISTLASQDVISGGYGNTIQTQVNSGNIAGGNDNVLGPYNSYETVGGGSSNSATGTAATIPGGANNTVSGTASFASGQYATAGNNNTYVWSDGQYNNYYGAYGITSTSNYQYLVQAKNGVGINTNNPGTNALSVAGTAAATHFKGDGTQLSFQINNPGTSNAFTWSDFTNNTTTLTNLQLPASQLMGAVSTNNLPSNLAALGQNNGGNLTNLTTSQITALPQIANISTNSFVVSVTVPGFITAYNGTYNLKVQDLAHGFRVFTNQNGRFLCQGDPGSLNQDWCFETATNGNGGSGFGDYENLTLANPFNNFTDDNNDGANIGCIVTPVYLSNVQSAGYASFNAPPYVASLVGTNLNVDLTVGDDSKGIFGYFPFKSINAAIASTTNPYPIYVSAGIDTSASDGIIQLRNGQCLYGAGKEKTTLLGCAVNPGNFSYLKDFSCIGTPAFGTSGYLGNASELMPTNVTCENVLFSTTAADQLEGPRTNWTFINSDFINAGTTMSWKIGGIETWVNCRITCVTNGTESYVQCWTVTTNSTGTLRIYGGFGASTNVSTDTGQSGCLVNFSATGRIELYGPNFMHSVNAHNPAIANLGGGTIVGSYYDNGVLATASTNAAPSNTTTPKLWEPYYYNGSLYMRALYQ